MSSVAAIRKENPTTNSLLVLLIIRTLCNKGSRVPLRGKVNEAVSSGVRVVDTILPIGRGQRQLIIGDRFTGNIHFKTMSSRNLQPTLFLISSSIMVLLQGLCYVVDITMVFLTFIGIFDFVFHLVELSRGLLLLNLPYRTVPGIYC